MELTPAIRLEARKELARRHFYDYCKLKYPAHYTPDRGFLAEMCHRIQGFTEQSERQFLVLTVPPRHYKSFTASNFVEWYFGREPHRKVMTGSYNETLSTTFARKVRDTIEERRVPGSDRLVYADIFPRTSVKYGQASASLWALEGSGQANYLATSPKGTATGFGADTILIDDIIKNDAEAYNELVLDSHWEWFVNTMLSRTEGDDWKVIAIMTRWATNDLAGRILDAYGDQVEHISFSAVLDDGSMLAPSILTRRSFELKTQEMNPDIVQANYNQAPIDVKGKLYGDFMVWDDLPASKYPLRKYNYTDTADKGPDFLCSVDYVIHDGNVYITDVYISDEIMEVTEPATAAMLDADQVDEAHVESNNGGRGFARNISRILKDDHGNTRCVVLDIDQTSNKEARILSSSAWVMHHVFMPYNWKHRWPDFYRQLSKYQKKGKNAHDDAPDVLAGIYEFVALNQPEDFVAATGDANDTETAELNDMDF